jgi:biopolymer transport protein ExbB
MSDCARFLKRLARALAAAAALAALATPAYAWQDGWSYRTRITLAPSQSGATGELGTQAVLIRLHSGNFSFKDAKPDGSDVRFFAGDDRTALGYQIERWDPTAEVGLVWVSVPGLSTAAATPIYVYYGNKKATPAGEAKAVFGSDALVWHFAEDGAPQDSSGNGVAGESGVARDPNGLIGPAAKLDGQSAISLPAAFSLSAPATISLWVKPAAAQANGTLFALAGGLTIGLQAGVPYVSAGSQRAQASAALATDSWTHVAAVLDGQKITLYAGGQSVAQLEGAPAASLSGQGSLGQGFSGEIDELEVSRAELSAGVIALAAQSQGPGAKLASFDTPEELKSGGHDYIRILFNALTPDAWVVIGVLAIMSLISWVVMIGKGAIFGRVASANDTFLDAYEKAVIGRSEHDGLADLPPALTNSSSSLAYLYRVGQRELKKRLEEGAAAGSRYVVSAQSIAAIRSALDAAQVRENRRLNRQMVLLTIAISGGPFLGLLGTVIGVMITFAAVAAAGDVNINAIAPGIAAALLATVAGLVVAIPALFGYNYLVSNFEEIADDDRIFVDELEKRIAEAYQERGSSGGSVLRAVSQS